MMRQASCWLLLGLGLNACTMSGNFIPSRMKNTYGHTHTHPQHRRSSNHLNNTDSMYLCARQQPCQTCDD